MRSTVYILFLLIAGVSAPAQKVLLKQWETDAIDTLYIQSDALSTVTLENSKGDVYYLKATLQGELAQETTIRTKTTGRTLRVGTGLAPYFTPENDKLAAHKVMSVDLEVRLPAGKSLVVYSKYGTVRANGRYNFFEVGLESGNCILTDFSGNARLYTVNGRILARCRPGISGKAVSENGEVTNKLSEGYPLLIRAESINGDIHLSTTQ